MGLDVYREKRNFDRTSEPRGRRAATAPGFSFVVHKHAARRLHYDFRLELDGVLLSWAIPKGPSLDPAVKRLAMQTEDHPLEYGEFEGVIPEGEYGAGTVLIWDRGTWKPEGDPREMYRRGRLLFSLEGEKLRGGFRLVRAPGREGDSKRWLLMKQADASARSGADADIVERLPDSAASGRTMQSIADDPDHVWSSHESGSRATPSPIPSLADHVGVKAAELPGRVEPALATLVAAPPEGDGWLHEIKLDGYRIVAHVDGSQVMLASRGGHDWTSKLPTVASALGARGLGRAVLDGEVVVLNEAGVSDFQRLQNSMEAGRDRHAVYFAFDLLFIDGFDVRGLPLVERKALLEARLGRPKSGPVRYGDHVQGNGARVFASACGLGLEGIVSKRADAPYRSGRSKDWLKVKCLARQEFVIGGFTSPGGSREHLGALLVGVREQGRLLYAGKVGTGFSRESLAELSRRLLPLVQSEPPFADPPRGAEARGVHWVKPVLVAEVAFTERTADGKIRHPSFQGLRDDKAAADVGLEQAVEAEPKRTSRKAGTAQRARSRASQAQRAERPGATEANAGRRATKARKKSAAAATSRRKKASAGTARAKANGAGRTKASKPSSSARKKPARAKPGSARKKQGSARTKASASRTKPGSARTKGHAGRDTVPTASRARRKRAIASGSDADAGASGPARLPAASLELDLERLAITNPDRTLYDDPHLTKRDLLLYYARVARWMLPYVSQRPLMLVRCPEGVTAPCFHQKHPSRGMPPAVEQVLVPQRSGPEHTLMIRDVAGLLGLVQMGALEIHAWGCRIERIECPDQLVFDLDPDTALAWEQVVEGARTLRALLLTRGLTPFVRVTGGKGLHLVVPVRPEVPWDAAKQFSKGLVEDMARAQPDKYLAVMAKRQRTGKIFLDYLRNGWGATAIASFSTRARPGAKVAVPIAWDELDAGVRSDSFDVQAAERRATTLARDPWHGFDAARVRIPV